jgi:hypothetical protein
MLLSGIAPDMDGARPGMMGADGGARAIISGG